MNNQKPTVVKLVSNFSLKKRYISVGNKYFINERILKNMEPLERRKRARVLPKNYKFVE